MTQRTVHACIGIAGAGKTTYLKASAKAPGRILVYDPLRNFDCGVRIESADELLHFCRFNEDQMREGNFHLLYSPIFDLKERETNEYHAELLIRLSRVVKDCEIYLDELDAFCNCRYIPPELDLIIRYGRNIGISLHAAVRRPKEVIPRHYMTELTHLTIFLTPDPEDAEYLSWRTSIDPQQIMNLNKFDYIDWNLGKVTYHVKVSSNISKEELEESEI